VIAQVSLLIGLVAVCVQPPISAVMWSLGIILSILHSPHP